MNYLNILSPKGIYNTNSWIFEYIFENFEYSFIIFNRYTFFELFEYSVN